MRRQNDPVRRHVYFGTAPGMDKAKVGERRMEPISYRKRLRRTTRRPTSSSCSQSPSISCLTLLEPHRQLELADFIGAQFRFTSGELTSDEMKSSARSSAQGHTEWESLKAIRRP